MSEPTQPDGQPPANPPRFDERSTGHDHGGADGAASSDPTPERARRPPDPTTVERPAAGPPPADATVVFPPNPAANPPAPSPPAQQAPAHYSAGSQPPPPGQFPPTNNPPIQYPPTEYPPTQQHPGVAAGPPPGAYAPGGPPTGPVGPGGPGYGGPPAGAPPQYGGPGGSNEPPKKKSGLLVAGLIALVVALVGALGFVALQSGGDDEADPVTTDEEREEDEPEPTVATTEPVVTPPPTEATTTTVVADGSVEGLFVHVEAFPDVIGEGELDATIQRIGLTDGNNPVSSADPVLNLCAALPVASPVSATVTWAVDNVSLSEGAERVLATPADGNCINNSGEPLAPGAYEVSFSDSAGAMSGVALFTVGAATVNQEFLNDTESDLCAVELAPSAAGFFQSFEVNGGEPLVVGDSILIDIAEIEHEIRGVDCAGTAAESFFASPSPDPISLASGAAVPPTTTAPPPQITDSELNDVDGEIGSLDVAVANGSNEETVVIDLLLDPETSLRIATEDPSLALCAAWDVAGPLEAEMVWEFNRAVIARFPVSTEGGRIGRCIPPGGPAFDEGAYQVYIERGEFFSEVETFTVGRAQTQLGFRNDTGVAICRVGFSPNLTSYYTFYNFAESADFEESVDPGDAFTIVAPFIENDIRAFDCDGNQVSEALDIPPTDQTLDLSTGRP